MRARRQFGLADPRTFRALSSLGSCLVHLDKGAEAEPILRESLSLREAAEPDAWTTFENRSLPGTALLSQRRFEAAESLIVSGYEGLKAREGAIPASRKSPCLSQAADRVVRVLRAMGQARPGGRVEVENWYRRSTTGCLWPAGSDGAPVNARRKACARRIPWRRCTS